VALTLRRSPRQLECARRTSSRASAAPHPTCTTTRLAHSISSTLTSGVSPSGSSRGEPLGAVVPPFEHFCYVIRMTRKRSNWIRALSVLALVVMGFLLIRHFLSGPTRTQQQFAQTKIGMSGNEVIEIVGQPARHSTPEIITWVRKTDQIIVYLDQNGNVKSKELWDARMDPLWKRVWRIFFC